RIVVPRRGVVVRPPRSGAQRRQFGAPARGRAAAWCGRRIVVHPRMPVAGMIRRAGPAPAVTVRGGIGRPRRIAGPGGVLAVTAVVGAGRAPRTRRRRRRWRWRGGGAARADRAPDVLGGVLVGRVAVLRSVQAVAGIGLRIGGVTALGGIDGIVAGPARAAPAPAPRPEAGITSIGHTAIVP